MDGSLWTAIPLLGSSIKVVFKLQINQTVIKNNQQKASKQEQEVDREGGRGVAATVCARALPQYAIQAMDLTSIADLSFSRLSTFQSTDKKATFSH